MTVYAVEEGALNSKLPITNTYVELRCKRAFSESYMTVSLVEGH